MHKCPFKNTYIILNIDLTLLGALLIFHTHFFLIYATLVTQCQSNIALQ